MTLVFSGHKTPTPDVIRLVDTLRGMHPDLVESLFDAADAVAAGVAGALDAGCLEKAGALMNAGQGIMEALGLSDPAMSAIVRALRAHDGIRGAKISGSGLGDCVLGVGRVESYAGPGQLIPAEWTAEGVRFEEASAGDGPGGNFA
jgi:mevalonate kinase